METSKLSVDGLPHVDWEAIWAWALGFVLVVYLGLKGGGFDPLVHDEVGIVVWWVILATVLVGTLPRSRPGLLAWCSPGLLAAFVLWTGLSLSWTESAEKTSADLARVSMYLGVFVLALFARGPRRARYIVAGVGAGVAVVAVIALLSRLHPAWFPEANQAATFLSSARERLSYPLDYWNGLAALIAIGIPAVLQIAVCAESIVARALAAAAMPAMALTLFFTLSRGGMAASVLALAIFLGLSSDRIPKLATLAVAGAGSAVLIAIAATHASLRHILVNPPALHQGNVLLVITLVVCAAVGLTQAGFTSLQRTRMRPRWMIVPRRRALIAVIASVALILVAAIAINAPGRISHAWTRFKHPDNYSVRGVDRLGSASGEDRYQHWSSAIRENQTKPLTGTGSGTFQFWWTRDADIPVAVRDTHSLYLQTLGELGIVGLLFLGTFLLTVLIGGVFSTVRAEFQERPQLAAAVAGCFAFCGTATFDWMWQIPVLPVAFLLLASVLMPTAAHPRREGSAILPLLPRLGFAVVALVVIAAISIPLASTSLVRESQMEAAAGHLPAALEKARDAQDAQPDAATPRLQQALILEDEGALALAASAALAATERESTNWRTWMVLSRIEAKRGHAISALHAYRKARSLNPRSALFRE